MLRIHKYPFCGEETVTNLRMVPRYLRMASRDYKYEVHVVKLERAMRVDKSLVEQLEKALSKKMISGMKKEAVECPVLKRQVSFLQCYACPNFVRRVRGVVYCRGLPLEGVVGNA